MTTEIAYVTVRQGASTQYLLAERADGGWQSGAQRFEDEDVELIESVVVTRVAGAARAGACATECVRRGAHQSRVDNLNTCTDRCEALDDVEAAR